MSAQQIAPEDTTSWYRAYWHSELVRLGLGLGVAFLIALALVLYVVVTHPLVEAIRGSR